MDKRILIFILLFCSTFLFGQSNSIDPRQLKFAPDERMILFSRDTVIGGANNDGRYFHWYADSVFQDRALDLVYTSNDTLYLVVVNSVNGVEDTLSVYIPSGGGGNLSAVMPITYNPGTETISTSVNEGRIVGRYSPGGAGVMQEITPEYGLTLKTDGDLEVDTSVIATQYDLTQINLDLQGVLDNGNTAEQSITLTTSPNASMTLGNADMSAQFGQKYVSFSAENNYISIGDNSNTSETRIFEPAAGGEGAFLSTTSGVDSELRFLSEYTASADITFRSITGTVALLGDDVSEFNNDAGYLTANQSITLSGDVTGTGTTAITTTIANNTVTNAKFRQSAGLSVVGVTGNSTASVADITAGTDGHVLRRSGTTLEFGLLTGSSISATNNQVVYGAGGVQSQSANFTFDGTNVGIGSPSALSHRLNVNGSVNIGNAFAYTPPAQGDFVVGSNSTNTRLLFGQGNSNYGGMQWNYNATAANAYLSLGNMNGTANNGFNILQNGNIGVNTTGPRARFEIVGNTLISGGDVWGTGSVSGITSGAEGLMTGYDATNDIAWMKALHNNVAYKPFRFGGSNISLWTDNSGAGLVERVTVLTTGLVGVGTNAPTSRLDVAGDVEIDVAGAFYIGDPTTDGTWRIVRSGNDLLSQRRESGVYVTKQTITP